MARARQLPETTPGQNSANDQFGRLRLEGVVGPCCRGTEGAPPHTLALLDRFGREDLRPLAEAYISSRYRERAVLGAMLADLTNFLAPLLRRLDRMSMAASVECRVPFLDHRLVNKAVNLPLSYRLHGSTDKWILKEIASHYLPKDIVYRKKVGFPLPLEDYLAPLAREELFRGGFCLEFLQFQRQGLADAITTWKHDVEGFFTLLTLEIWGRLFFLRQPLEEVTELVMRRSGQTGASPRVSVGKHGDLSSGPEESSAA